VIRCLLLLGLLTATPVAMAAPGLTAFNVVTGPDGAQTYSLSIQILALMTGLTLLPAALIMMTAFTRIIVVLAILRQALGTGQTPSSQVMLGLALFLTLFVMAPVFTQINAQAVQPFAQQRIGLGEALKRGAKPLRGFMLSHTRESDLVLFENIAGRKPAASPEGVPLTLLMPAFLTSELKTAFQIGFLIFIPFLIIDLVVASVLMSMGMMMLSPLIISFPFKLMLFVLVDGWALIAGTLASSFAI